jgi:hypothetical protein
MIRNVFIQILAVTMLFSVISIKEVKGKKKVVLLPFNSKGNKKGTKKIRNFIKTLLKGNYEYVTKKTIKEEEGDIDFRNIEDDKIKDICSKFSITSFVGGKISKEKWKNYFTIYIYTWVDGSKVLEKKFKLKRRNPSQKDIETIAMAALQAIENIKEYEAPKPVVKETEPDANQIKEEEKPEEKPIKVKKKKRVPSGLPKLRAGLAFGFFSRSLDFDPASEPYYKTASLSIAPILNLEVYPMGFKDTSSPLSNIGIGLRTFYMPAFKTYPSDNKDEKVDTMILDFGLNLLYRHKLTDTLVILGKLGYHSLNWTFADNDVLQVPGVSYSMFEVGGLARLNVAKVAVVEGGLSFYLPLNAGEIVSADYYGQASVFGMKFNFLFGYEVAKNIQATVSFEYTRLSYSFSGDGQRDANGAVDQYISFALGGRFVF